MRHGGQAWWRQLSQLSSTPTDACPRDGDGEVEGEGEVEVEVEVDLGTWAGLQTGRRGRGTARWWR